MAADEDFGNAQHFLWHPGVCGHVDCRVANTGDETSGQHLRQTGQRGCHRPHHHLSGGNQTFLPHPRLAPTDEVPHPIPHEAQAGAGGGACGPATHAHRAGLRQHEQEHGGGAHHHRTGDVAGRHRQVGRNHRCQHQHGTHQEHLFQKFASPRRGGHHQPQPHHGGGLHPAREP